MARRPGLVASAAKEYIVIPEVHISSVAGRRAY